MIGLRLQQRENTHREFERLRKQSQQLRLEFVRSELEISSTLATFANNRHFSDVLQECSYLTAAKGYHTAVKLLSEAESGEARRALEIEVERLRATLAQTRTDRISRSRDRAGALRHP
ncbi:MAG: hypothetical protein C5B51_02610 [Terriglobia bacterium]|nr:MAG: hypothetical protein C5B51_02610 [Terriglobia bacterium]